MEETIMAAVVWGNNKLIHALNKPDATVALFFEIPGIPRPYTSPRKGPNGWYDPKAAVKESARWYLKAQYSYDPIRRPVKIGFTFEMPIPKSWPKKKKQAALRGDLPHATTPDVDNLVKLYMDCMKKIVIWDDNQVWKLSPSPVKKYSNKPKTIIWVYE
jgi:Holliday junction resolvase RusA-like endonuclease